MRQWFFFIGWIASFGVAAQTGPLDDPVFISQEVDDVDYESFSLNTSYYTIVNNIDNQQSSSFISDSPSPEEYLYFAQHQPSYSFLVHRRRSVLAMITFHQRPTAGGDDFTYTILNPASGRRRKVPSRLSGQITQQRARELITQQLVDSARLLYDTLLQIGDTDYVVLPLPKVKQEVVTLAQQLLVQQRGKASELEEYIRTETIGGTLDFAVALAEEPRRYFSRGGVVYDKARFSVLLWGGAVRMLGLRSEQNARTLWEDIQQRPLTLPEWRALRSGFREQHTERP